jgi:hypothetical protein
LIGGNVADRDVDVLNISGVGSCTSQKAEVVGVVIGRRYVNNPVVVAVGVIRRGRGLLTSERIVSSRTDWGIRTCSERLTAVFEALCFQETLEHSFIGPC